MKSFKFEDLIMQEGYTLLQIKILIVLKNKLDFDNRIQTFRQNELAKELDSAQASISRTLKKIERDGIIYKKKFDYYFNDKFIEDNKIERKGE